MFTNPDQQGPQGPGTAPLGAPSAGPQPADAPAMGRQTPAPQMALVPIIAYVYMPIDACTQQPLPQVQPMPPVAPQTADGPQAPGGYVGMPANGPQGPEGMPPMGPGPMGAPEGMPPMGPGPMGPGGFPGGPDVKENAACRRDALGLCPKDLYPEIYGSATAGTTADRNTASEEESAEPAEPAAENNAGDGCR